MILETGRIAAIETEGLWVETIRKSACGSCKAEKGCGQSLMNKWDGHSAYIWVLLEGRDPASYQLGDEIRIGIPEEVIAKGALLVYMVPLLTLVIATALAHHQFAQEGITTLSGFAGLLLGGLIVRWHSWRTRLDSNLQPVLVDDSAPLHFYPSAEQH
ncbi:MAG: SoxR reducing system RseC family protein [Cellvibrio sp.]|uniref:SoxR reducing system RseC family protein n=1 Tax=Cellvibrio sp. TaxID=1965322 RepID=UPI0031ABA072